jgi:hypothetical protein
MVASDGDEVSGPPDPEATTAVRQLVRSFGSIDSYGLVLLMIVVTYVLAISLSETWAFAIVLFAQIATVWFTLRTSRARRAVRRAGDILLVLAGLVAVAYLVTGADDTFVAWVFVVGAALYFVAPFSIIRHVAFRRDVDRETMLGALSAYLLFGMAFGFAYRVITDAQSGPFFGAAGEGTLADDLFFSFVTLTTTGYGNLVPATNPGQSLAVLEALLGQLFLVTAVAKIVSAWRPRAWRNGGPIPGEHHEPGR